MSRNDERLRLFKGIAIKRPHGYITIRVRRQGVESTAGCILAAPIWAWTRMRWQLGSRLWVAELISSGRSGVGRPVRDEAFPTREDAMDRGVEWCKAAEQGDYDEAS